MGYKLADYGPNPNAGVNVNADNGWGAYKWPAGVPSNLLGIASYNYGGQNLRVTVRKELVELFVLAFRIAEKHGYQIYAKNPNGNGEPWGPWNYENRPIGGGSTASNHSRGRANDWNAPRNSQSTTFICDMPPAMVRDLESIGLCWGGRYKPPTKYDPMHWEYGYTPADVARHVARAKMLLGGAPVSIPKDAATGAAVGSAIGGVGGKISWSDKATRQDIQRVFETQWGVD